MLSKTWRLRALLPAQGAAVFNARTLRLCDSGGPLDADAALSCPLPAGGAGLGALTDGDTTTFAVFDAVDIHSPGWFIQWDFSSAVEATFLATDADPFYGFVLEAMADTGLWEAVIGRARDEAFNGMLSLATVSDATGAFTQTSQVRNLNMSGGGYVSQDMFDGGVRSSVTYNSVMCAFDVMPQMVKFKGMKARFDFKITEDSLSRRHAGFWLFDPENPTYGYRIATLDGTIGLSYFPGALGSPEVVYQQLPMPKGALALNTRYRMGVSVDDVGTITVTIDDEFVVTFNPPGLLLANVRIGAFFYVGAYVVYSCGLTTEVIVEDTRNPIAASLPLYKDVGVAPVDASYASVRAPAIAADVEFGGRGVIYGTVRDDKSQKLLQRRVRLYRSRDSYLVRENWSAADGKYRFEGINERYEYDIEAWDHEKNYFTVVANNQLAEVSA